MNRSVLKVITAAFLIVYYSYLFTYLLTGLQLVKKFPTFYGTRSFITAFTTARHLFLS
jgi:hypothetical protein